MTVIDVLKSAIAAVALLDALNSMPHATAGSFISTSSPFTFVLTRAPHAPARSPAFLTPQELREEIEEEKRWKKKEKKELWFGIKPLYLFFLLLFTLPTIFTVLDYFFNFSQVEARTGPEPPGEGGAGFDQNFIPARHSYHTRAVQNSTRESPI